MAPLDPSGRGVFFSRQHCPRTGRREFTFRVPRVDSRPTKRHPPAPPFFPAPNAGRCGGMTKPVDSRLLCSLSISTFFLAYASAITAVSPSGVSLSPPLYLRVISKQFPYMLNVIPLVPQRPAQHLAWTPKLSVHADNLLRAFERR